MIQQFLVVDVTDDDGEGHAKIRHQALVATRCWQEAIWIALETWYPDELGQHPNGGLAAGGEGSYVDWGSSDGPRIVFVPHNLTDLEHFELIPEGRFKPGPTSMREALQYLIDQPDLKRRLDRAPYVSFFNPPTMREPDILRAVLRRGIPGEIPVPLSS